MLKKFVVAFISNFDNDLTQEIVTACNEYSAIENYLNSKGYEIPFEAKSIEELKHFAFDCDANISAIEI